MNLKTVSKMTFCSQGVFFNLLRQNQQLFHERAIFKRMTHVIQRLRLNKLEIKLFPRTKLILQSSNSFIYATRARLNPFFGKNDFSRKSSIQRDETRDTRVQRGHSWYHTF